MIDRLDIPKTWEVKKLESLIKVALGGDWGKDTTHEDASFELAYCIRGSEMRNWDEEKGRTASLRKIKKSSIENRKLREGDILVEISGGGPEQPVGRTVLIDKTVMNFEPTIPKLCTNFLRLIRPIEEVNSKFLNIYLKFFYRSGEIVKYQGGSNNLRNLKFPDYIKIDIPIPSVLLQQQIVSKIEELFSELDKGIEELKTAQQQLKVYRQAVLKWAFKGKLTNEDVKEGELPKGWKHAKIGEVCKCIVPNRDKPKSFSGDIRWITTPNLTENFIKLNYSNLNLGLTQEEVRQYNARVIPVDSVIMTCVGTFGLSAVVEKPIVINQQLHAFITNDKVHPKYLAYCIQYSKHYFESKSTSTTIQYLNKENCNSMPFPLCSIEAQQQIVQEIESRLSVCDKIEETITNSLKQSEALRQSILKKAFEGKLI